MNLYSVHTSPGRKKRFVFDTSQVSMTNIFKNHMLTWHKLNEDLADADACGLEVSRLGACIYRGVETNFLEESDNYGVYSIVLVWSYASDILFCAWLEL